MNLVYVTLRWCLKTTSRGTPRSLWSGGNLDLLDHRKFCIQLSTQEDTVCTSSENKDESCPTSDTSNKRVPVKRFALVISFLGYNYHGMQFNGPLPTIEREIFKALHHAGYCDVLDNRHNVLHFNRVSRTDSGVSALRQVVSMKLPVNVNVENINQHLPSDIRIIAARRVSGPFHLQKICESRTYCYVIPTFAFCHFEREPECPYHYRIDADTLYTVNDLLSAYVGLHRFHNYTKQRDMMDQRSYRSILKFHSSDAYLMGETEVVDLHVTGTSFMLHHIRKMVGMLVAVMRGKASQSMIKETFSSPKMPTPIAPGIGLFLEKPNFKKYITSGENSLNWEEHDVEIDKFRMNLLIPFIVRVERQDGIILDFLGDLRRHSFKDNRPVKEEDEEEAIVQEIHKINYLISESECLVT